ncbi:Vacuolar protein sorting-associated protein 68 [Extremus antarcticus]|uniref:Vacuolar protein sorting-associated protein 68 n=1 Tax=Extremus antarcticus TaxID=702011 RepID=A0AAJ0G6C1_9PEZI|nr:Vacuolar protein sorting-associated protein 68 [Extremus antarcticus]
MSDSRLFRFPKPAWLNSATTRSAGVYAAGALFAIALFLQIDAATFSKSHLNGSVFNVTFIDWIPGIFSLLGLLIINSIDKTRLSGDSFSYSGDDGVAWKARVVLFMGFAAMAGGLAGGVTVCVLKYVVKGAEWPALWFGIACVVGNAGVMMSTVVLWISQNMEDDYTYNLAL